MKTDNKIQVDMFDVQLGSALLIQMSLEQDRVVRIIADAGVHAAGYPRTTVANKLPDCFKHFNNFSEEPHWTIDLLIGSHYDKDHIYGLKSIVENNNYKITEAWLPYVINDTELYSEEDSMEKASLGAQLINDEKVLENYLEFHEDLCKWTNYWIDRLQDQKNIKAKEVSIHDYEIDAENPRKEILTKFLRYEQEANNILNSCSEINVDHDISDDFLRHNSYMFRRMFKRSLRHKHPFHYEEIFYEFRHNPNNSLKYLASIQKGSSKNAINAIYLDELIEALKIKSIPIHYHSIDQGKPETFFFNGLSFTKQSTVQPKITILGPSKELISKHIDKIPIWQNFLSFNIRHTTPSNELSYVLLIEYLEQKILITGDSGFKDFKPFVQKSQNYFQSILNYLDPLHVVQIAHHGGINGFFYEALDQAGYIQNKKNKSYHLLSHELHSNSRPSQEYLDFFNTMKKNNCNFELVFTSQPQSSKLKILQTNKAPCTSSNVTNSGDARLVYNGFIWNITKHMI